MTQCDEAIYRKMRRPIVYVMIGAPASGKSTHAKSLHGRIISSDAIRVKLYGDESIQGNSADVFTVFYSMAKIELAKGNDIILDATNLTVKNRKNVFNNLKGYNCKYIAVVCFSPLETLLERNRNRSRVVPEDVVTRMYKSFQEPSYEEGFDEIWKD